MFKNVCSDGPGMQRPDTIDEDGNMFEPQCILKDGTIVKAEPVPAGEPSQPSEGGGEMGGRESNGGPMCSPLGLDFFFWSKPSKKQCFLEGFFRLFFNHFKCNWGMMCCRPNPIFFTLHRNFFKRNSVF